MAFSLPWLVSLFMSNKINEILKPYREKIDNLDNQIIDLLGHRLDIINEVAVIKLQEGISPILKDRVDEVRNRCASMAVAKGYDAEVVSKIYSLIIDYSCEVEQEYQDMNKFNKKEN